MGHPLDKKCVKATCSISLHNHIVDGKFYSITDFNIPSIEPDDIFYVKEVRGEVATLASITSSDFDICQIKLDEIEDFIVSSPENIDL